MAFVQRSADQQQRHLFFNTDRSDVYMLQKPYSIRDERLDIFENDMRHC